MAYALSGVKEHVKQAAEYFGQKHGYKTVYGWRATGSVPGSDHPKGLALDFMGSDRTKGDALVADLIANVSAWNITYIIWQRRIWDTSSGWKSYSGPSPHTDHVHVSFGSTAGTGVTTAQNVSSSLIPDWVGQLQSTLKLLDQGMEWFTDAQNWKRIAMMSVGVILLLMAVFGAGRTTSAATNVAKKVSKSG